MTTFSTSWTNASAAGNLADTILGCLQTACNQWAPLLQSSANITVELTIGDVGGAIAEGGSAFYTNAQGLFEPVAISKMRSGDDPNGSAADITVTLSPSYVTQLSYASGLGSAVPSSQVDALTVFEHEVGHGLGIDDIPSSVYDGFVRTSGGQNTFTGPNVEAAAGGPVTLDDSKSHVEIAGDLMSPSLAPGARRSIGDVDEGLLQDAGAPIATNRSDTITLGSAQTSFSGLGGNDVISAGDGPILILGNAGDDAIVAGAGADTLLGGQGDDSIVAGDGDNLLFGNEGQDTIRAGNGNNTIRGGQDQTDGADLIVSGGGADLIFGNGGDDTIASGAGADSVVGGFGNDILLGNGGNDLILGNQGDDVVYGGLGDDTIFGGQGNDTLVGGAGNDLMVGNDGSNTYVFAPGDTGFASGVGTGDEIADFKTGSDKVVFTQGAPASPANFGAVAVGSSNFADVQSAAQSLVNGGDRYAFVTDGHTGYLFADQNGDRSIDDAIKIDGALTTAAFSASDIVGRALA